MTQASSSDSNSVNSNKIRALQADSEDQKPLNKTEVLQESLERTQRCLALCDQKIMKLEVDTEAIEALAIKDLRCLAKTVIDLEKNLKGFEAAIENSVEPDELNAIEELLVSTVFKDGTIPAHLTRADFIGGFSPEVHRILEEQRRDLNAIVPPNTLEL